tara:strand:- start:37319 stop:39586 length:2268 start_codon:yes stop_codon:yes gene_type:complete
MNIIIVFLLTIGLNYSFAQKLVATTHIGDKFEWTPVGNKIKTKWALGVTPSNAWQQYPRPQLVRNEWKNLNGLWDYAIRPKEKKAPSNFDGEILVPFCIESSLSGVGKPLLPEDELWYRTTFNVSNWKGKEILIHFGAVDFKSTLYINGKKVGVHEGGNDPFSYNISAFLNSKKQTQELKLSVWDPTDTGIQPRGKQILKPKGFWYTAVSGIWQTVWLEPVEKTHVEQIYTVSDIDKNQVTLVTDLKKPKGNEEYLITVKFKDSLISKDSFKAKKDIILNMPNPKLWSPEFPNLYDFTVKVISNGNTLDEFSSYFAMRKITLGQDRYGYTKLFLNNKELFHWGTLDQGWWPDGLLTPPTEEAMVYDMQVVKDLGFNTIRKHIKVEPARYYYNADKLGLFLWQDMPSGFLDINHPEQHVKHDSEEDWNRPEESANQFKNEWKNIMDNLRFFPSIVVWIPFNEGWGQFQSKEITKWTMDYDTSRLTNGISGWSDRKVGHFYDAHQYPGPGMEPVSQNKGRAVVVGEFGGHGYPVEGHIWDASRKNWGYRTYVEEEEFFNQYTQAIYNLYPEKARGLAAAIYTQTTDVEAEVNGLMTYDRKVLKLPKTFAQVLHNNLYNNFEKASFIIEDAEINKKKRQLAEGELGENWELNTQDNTAFNLVDFPNSLNIGKSAYSYQEFDVKDIPENLALKFYGNGDVKVYLNGTKIYDNYLRTKRHYDDINLSTHTKFLKTGKNTMAIEIKNPTEDGAFDYGLYSY